MHFFRVKFVFSFNFYSDYSLHFQNVYYSINIVFCDLLDLISTNNSTIYESGLIYTFDLVILVTIAKITQNIIKLFHVFEGFNKVINVIRIPISELLKRRFLKH